MQKILLLLFLYTSLSAQQTYIHCGHLWDGTTSAFQKEYTIVIYADSIVAVQKGFEKAGKR